MLYDGTNVAFDFRHMRVLVATLQMHREIIAKPLKFGVPVNTSDLEATTGIDSGNPADAGQKVTTGT
jgi:hypothetical protein